MQMHSNPAATRKTYITAKSNQKKSKRNRQRNIIWFNPPFNERRPKIPKADRQAFPGKLKATQNIQQKHCKGQLQLHAKPSQHHQGTEQ